MKSNIRKEIKNFIKENVEEKDEYLRFTLQDMKEAFEAGRKTSWTDINQEEKEPYYYDFFDWYNSKPR